MCGDSGAMEVFLDFAVEAAHLLPKVPAGHPCGSLHGHTWKITVIVAGPIDEEMGWVVDYGVVIAAFEPLRLELDHHYLNDIAGLENPTTENLARWIWRRLAPVLPGLCRLQIRETGNSGCIYAGE